MWHRIGQTLLLSFVMIWVSGVQAAYQFKKGETVLVGFPAANIKDDAYIIGLVTGRSDQGDYQIHVKDYVAGHDYGVSCTPIVTSEALHGEQNPWEMWNDKTTLMMVEGVDYLVPADRVQKLAKGQMYFIDRYNVYVTYSRWKSQAPILPVDKLAMAQRDARLVDMEEMDSAFEIAKLNRLSFYEGNFGRPYWPWETLPHLIVKLDYIIQLLDKDAELNRLWRAKKRDWDKINQSQYWYFTIDAIDQAVDEARFQFDEDLTKAKAEDQTKLKTQLDYLGAKYTRQ